jgi:signal transduction histidine kinase
MQRDNNARVWISRAIDDHPYIASSAMVATVTAFGFAADSFIQTANLDVLYLLAVFISALRWGRRPAVFCALTAAVTFDFCFVPFRYRFQISDLPYLITLFGFVAVALVTSELASRARRAILIERARADAEAARANAEAARVELEAMNRAKDAVLDRIAHELRSPLTAILARVQLLQKTVNDPTQLAPLAKLEHSTLAIARLVSDLLDASRIHVGKLRVHLEPAALTPAVARVVEDMTFAAAEKGVVIEQDLEPVPNVLADLDRVGQIVTNLVMNAVKFTPRAGHVNVRLRTAADAVELMVADTGVGISPEFLPHVFEPFAQADSGTRHDGVGLGLAIVKHLVDAHGAQIAVTSSGVDAGTTFTVRFPLIAISGAMAELSSHPTDVVH